MYHILTVDEGLFNRHHHPSESSGEIPAASWPRRDFPSGESRRVSASPFILPDFIPDFITAPREFLTAHRVSRLGGIVELREDLFRDLSSPYPLPQMSEVSARQIVP